MINDEQRREVAAKLRAMVSDRSYEIPGGRGSLVDIDDLLTNLLGRRVYDSEESVDSFEAMYVADLIDRPTTTRHGKFKTKYGRETPCCEVCGYSIGDLRWNYCPNAVRRLQMPSDKEKREAVEFLRSGTCLYFSEHRKRQLDCTRCMKVSTMLFGHYDALCGLDSCGTDAWQRLADLIDRPSENIERPR